jgi:hypothetical protein
MSHGVEREVVVLPYAVVVAQEFQPRLEDTRLSVLVRYAKHDDGSSIIVVEIDPFRDFASGDRQHDCSSAIVARFPVVL